MNVKVLFSGIIILLLSAKISRSQESAGAFSFSTSITGDFTHCYADTRMHGLGYLGMEDLMISFSTEGAKLWKGGILRVHALNTHGIMPSAEYTGDMQVFDNIEAGDHIGFFELVYEQKFGNFFLLIGQHDLNADFASTLYCDLYLNSSFGVPPTLSLNIPVSIYPVTAACIYGKYVTKSKWLFRLATYDGNPGSFSNNRYGLNLAMRQKEGYFTIGEAEYANLANFKMAGIFKLGAYYHSGSFTSVSDSTEHFKGNYGFYTLVAKRLAPSLRAGGEGLNGFIQAGIAPLDRNRVSHYLATGVRIGGFFHNKLVDMIGLSVAYAGVPEKYIRESGSNGKGETSLEFTYRLTVNEYYTIQPDLQYLIHPGAPDGGSNAVAATLRFRVEF